MATYHFETNTTLIVTNHEGAEYRIPLPFSLDIAHGPFIRDNGATIAWTVRDMATEDYDWPEGIEEINRPHFIDRHSNPGEVYAQRYREHVMIPAALDDEHHYFMVHVDHDGRGTQVSMTTPMEAIRGGAWTHLVKLERVEGWDAKGYLEAVLSEARSFYEGDVYGVFEAHRDEEGAWVIEDVWGYIGWEYAEQVASGPGTMREASATMA